MLAGDRNFHRPEGSERIEEQTYEYEIEYLRMLVQDDQPHPRTGQCPGLSHAERRAVPDLSLSGNTSPVATRGQRASPGPCRPASLCVFMTTPYPRVLTQRRPRPTSVWNASRRRPQLPAAVHSAPVPRRGGRSAHSDSPVEQGAQEEIKWYVADRDFSPFSSLMDTPDDRRGTPWVRSEVKTIVRVSLGIERRKDLAMQPGEPAPSPLPTSSDCY